MSNYNTHFVKNYAPKWCGEFFVIKIVKNLASRTYAIQEPNCEEIVTTFNGIKLQKTNQTESRVETVIKKEGNRSSVKEKVIMTHLIAE